MTNATNLTNGGTYIVARGQMATFKRSIKAFGLKIASVEKLDDCSLVTLA